MAERFLRFLRERAPTDWWGFAVLLRAVAERPTRVELAESYVASRSWKPSVATSCSQGYLARGREWSLVEGGLIDGRYALTDFGESVLSAAVPQRGTR
jgi:hypothetical protein